MDGGDDAGIVESPIWGLTPPNTPHSHPPLPYGLHFLPAPPGAQRSTAGGSRLVDASTARIQLRIDPLGEAFHPDDLRVIVKGHAVPLRTEHLAGQAVHLIGIRFRSFVPWSGLHPAIGAEKTVPIVLEHRSGSVLRITLFPWRPSGEAYPGLPDSLADAAARRGERFVVEHLAGVPPSRVPVAPSYVSTPYCVDLRRLPAGGG